MTEKWSFNKQFLEEVINKGYVLLEDPKVSKNRKSGIRCDIRAFENFIKNDFEDDYSSKSNPPKDMEKLKTCILKKMQKQYKELGPELILWTMDLSYEGIFEDSFATKQTELTIDEQAELTLENYSKNSKKFYAPAKTILSNKIISQVQLAENIGSSSFCYRDTIIEIPFLIIDPTEASWVLNHETQHAIEEIIRYKTNPLYDELGSIFFEMLHNDTLYQHQNFLRKGDYMDRISNCKYQLNLMFEYFNIMLKFADSSFDVTTEEFKKEFMDQMNIPEEELYDFLREEIATNENESDMTYLYSYLKAIELREQSLSKQQDCADILEPYINTKKFNFKPKKELLNTYKRFTKEMEAKTK